MAPSPNAPTAPPLLDTPTSRNRWYRLWREAANDPATAPANAPLLPLASPEGARPLLSQRRLDQLILVFVVLGLVARCVRYFLRFPLWEDECFLCVNLIQRDFVGLLDPLTYHQVAPPLFLWLQLATVKLFGFNEMSLRLIPFLCGLGSILLFWRLACRCLTGLPRLVAVAVFSVTYATVRYSAEAKPYGVDLFVALVLLTFMVNWLQQPGRTAWLWALAATILLAVGLSYGAVMLGGGLCLAIAWVVWERRRWESVLPWAAYTVALLAGFGVLYFVCMRHQEASELAAMREMWKEHFPPLESSGYFAFWKLPYWLLHTHTGDILAYPVGGSPHQSSLTALCWLAGLVALARRKQWAFLLLCLAPLGVIFVAAALHRFPYGGHPRLHLYLAPLMCLLIGYGLTVLLAWRRTWRPAVWLWSVLALLALTSVATIGRDLAGPYKSVCDERQRAFAEWFWPSAEHNAEVCCLKTDLGLDFAPDSYRELCFSAEYLCNERIYSPRHAAGKAVDWDSISATHPLRCVLYRTPPRKESPYFQFDEVAFQTWLDEMQAKYDLVGHESYPLVRLKNRGSLLNNENSIAVVDSIEIYRFVPKRAVAE